MRSAIVFESKFGNTAEIARCIGEGLAAAGPVEMLSPAEATAARLSDVDMLVVGTPTHAWSMPRRKGWSSAAGGAEVPASLVREWIGSVPQGRGRFAAGFSTRLNKPRLLTGAADRGIVKRLVRRGWRSIGHESFVVTGTSGPLADGEQVRAGEWGRSLQRQAPVASRG